HPQSPRAQYELAWAYMFYIVSTKDASLAPLAVAAAERSKAADKGSINQDVGLGYMFAELHDMPKAQAYLDAAAVDATTASPSATLQLALLTLTYMTSPEDQPLFASMDKVMTNAAANPTLAHYGCYTAVTWNSLALFRQKIGNIPGALNAMHQAVTLCPVLAQMRVNFARMLLYYNDPQDAGEQIDALRHLGDVRFLPDLLQLEQQRDQELHPENKK
ncbi:MAG TPA: hypothetical protein VGS99_00755, partial [Gammaproteobacteria bacterium]|nr:hypothetical protein [Gammaproteobacteria bacterium]